MNIEELKLTPEEIQKLWESWIAGNLDGIEEFDECLCKSQIQKILNHPSICIKADDQTLPKPSWNISLEQLSRQGELWQCRLAGYEDAVQDMLADNWVKTVPKEGKDGNVDQV